MDVPRQLSISLQMARVRIAAFSNFAQGEQSQEEIIGSVQGGRGLSMGVKLVPPMVTPKGLQTEESLIADRSPELASPFKTALILTAGRFDSSGA